MNKQTGRTIASQSNRCHGDQAGQKSQRVRSVWSIVHSDCPQRGAMVSRCATRVKGTRATMVGVPCYGGPLEDSPCYSGLKRTTLWRKPFEEVFQRTLFVMVVLQRVPPVTAVVNGHPLLRLFFYEHTKWRSNRPRRLGARTSGRQTYKDRHTGSPKFYIFRQKLHTKNPTYFWSANFE